MYYRVFSVIVNSTISYEFVRPPCCFYSLLLVLVLFFSSFPNKPQVFPLSSIRSLTPWYFSLCCSLTPTMIPFSFPGFYSYAKIWTPIDDLERGASNEIGSFWFLGLSCLTYDLFQFQHLTTKVMTYFPSQLNSIPQSICTILPK